MPCRLSPLVLALLLASAPGQAGWNDLIESARGVLGGDADSASAGADGSTSAAPVSSAAAESAGVSEALAGEGLQQALVIAVERVVTRLGSTDAFLQDPQLRIPLPPQLAQVEPLLRGIGQQAYAERFVTSMNQAAARSVREAGDLLIRTARSLSYSDALQILQGPEDAATRHLRAQAGEELRQRMLPIVQSATADNQLTAAYKGLVDQALSASPMLGSLLGMEAQDLDGYVTDRALDRLYLTLAEQEARIRQDPTAWTTDTLKRAFGSLFPG